jgi:hypothetical protein
MIKILVYLAILITPGPKASLHIAANVEHADYAELYRIARRESALRTVGAHTADSWAASTMWGRARDVGWISKDCPSADTAVHGILGLSAPFHFRWLGLRCARPEIFDVPIVSAFAGARKHNARCWTYRRDESVVDPSTGTFRVERVRNPAGAHGWCG